LFSFSSVGVVFMALREDKMGQSWLLPPAVSDLIPQDHICQLVVALVDDLDVNGVEKKYRCMRGNPAYSRRMLLRLVIMASVDGVWSSRKIAKLAAENVVYMYLTGSDTPDFRTICKFKIECQDLIEQAFKKTVNVSKKLGIAKLGHISIDGTKIKANASNNHTLTKEDVKNIKKIIKKGIEADEEEDKLYGDERGDQLPPKLNTKKKIREKIKEIERSEDKKLKSVAKKVIEQHALADAKIRKKSSIKSTRQNKSWKKAVRKWLVYLTLKHDSWRIKRSLRSYHIIFR